MRRKLLAWATVLAVGCVPGAGLRAETAASEPAWHAVQSADNGVQTEFPSEPKYESIQLLSGQGFPYAMHQYVWARESTVFQLQTVVYPKDVNVVPQANIKAGLDASAGNLAGGQWETVSWTRHQGFVAADALGTRAGHTVRVFSVIKGQRLVTLTYVGPPDTARAERVERFFKSLRLQ